jgi:N-hydroxyarylamine O-acetyltransferase
MSIVVQTDKLWLADVGYGDLFLTPVEIMENKVQSDDRNYFWIQKSGIDDFILLMSPDKADFVKKYSFNLKACSVTDFEDGCIEKQTSSHSYFVKNLVCTKATPEGRITIFNDKLIEKHFDQKTELEIEGDNDLRKYLKNKFEIDLS